jgi:hypothetical protein
MDKLIKFDKSASLVTDLNSHKPLSKGLSNLDGQSDLQADQITEQLHILIKRAKELEERKRISKIIYSSEFGFQPVVKSVYHLYQKDSRKFVSMIAPQEWGRKNKNNITFIATIRLDYDHTWEIIEFGLQEFFIPN